ncbi:hypothetical protein H0266_17325 [Halobacillus locisalis]|uniref:CBS domain-containing protein n=1 Tax=Halobacillus locisalis TaxID=220753 RepID=A0A838CWX7_9BACI|nr:DUF294 nucleotidyltransferase-like domain-containing protein [Halobacillus locisalis]MBA2176652.1 hypothetical protein [Halobacillus locisalis]
MFTTYNELKQWREETLESVAGDHFQLNAFHDQLIYQTVALAKDKVESEQGSPPAPFAFFLMGSAGRYEQSVWSDQDHGILFEGDNQEYFLRLGSEISDGLAVVGYEYCEGDVMASNPLWCQSYHSFEKQTLDWLNEASWQTMRHFSILFDSRVLVGEAEYLLALKQRIFKALQEEPRLMSRFIDNVNYIKKGIGVFGQLLPEQQGEKRGTIQLKQTAYFPYVNALRILALFQGVSSPSTISRFEQLAGTYPSIAEYEKDFRELLDFRLRFRKEASSYEMVHLLPLECLSKHDKQQLKRLIKRGQSLFSAAKSIVKEERMV